MEVKEHHHLQVGAGEEEPVKEAELARSERGTQVVRCHDGHVDRAVHSGLRREYMYREANAFSGTVRPSHPLWEAHMLSWQLWSRET